VLAEEQLAEARQRPPSHYQYYYTPTTMFKESQALAITVCYGMWSLGFTLISSYYMGSVFANRDHLELRIRGANLTIFEVFVMAILAIYTASREICVAWGIEMSPCYERIAFSLSINVIFTATPYRYAQIIIVFDRNLRRSYYRHIRKIRSIFLLWMAVAFLAIFLLLQLGVKGCISM